MADPTVLGRYHLVEPLGGGPTGEVFRAKVYGVAGFERQFAVKRFHSALVANPAAAEALATAAKTYASLSHARIAALHEHGGTYQAVELVEGLDLGRLIAATTGAGEPMPLGARLGILSQVARVIAYAHGRGATHLGICPTNAIATPEGDIKVCDFGSLVSRIRGRSAEDPTLAARLPYLCPEQLQGVPGTPMTDVFALATLGHELISGERAFAGKTPAEIAARISQGATRLPDVPDGVADVLRRAFLPRPEDRYPDAGAFADALEAALRRASMPGGRGDVAAAVRKASARAAEQRAQGASGAVSFPLPAPPRSLPGPPLTEVFPDGQVPTVPVQKTLLGVPPPPAPPLRAEPPRAEPPREEPPRAEIHEEPEMPEVMLLEEEPPAPRPRPKRQTIPPPIPLEMRPPEDLTPTTAWKPTASPRAGRRVLLIFTVLSAVVLGVAIVATQVGSGQRSGTAAARAKDGGAEVASTAIPAPPPAPAPAPARAPAPVPVPVPDAVPVPAPAAAPAAVPAAAPAPAAVATPPPPEPPPTGKLVITSAPAGALVYLDGAAKGRTPVELAGSGDRHRLALLLPGHKLHKSDVAGGGRIDIRLEPAAKLKGPAGIKVLCKSKDRFYITVDGVETGMLCPTDRIGVALGKHTVEIYDAVSDAASSHNLDVRETHNSVRLKVEETPN